MRLLRELKKKLLIPVIGAVFAVSSLFSAPLSTPVYAEPETSEQETAESTSEETSDTCYDQVGALGWFICPGTGVLANAIDNIYGVIEQLLTVEPVTTDNSSPIYRIWQRVRDLTNIVFIVFMLIVIYSQLTGLGVSNYGIKKALPKLIICAILVNTSFIICSVLVDVSNILGTSLRGLFSSVQEEVIASGGTFAVASEITWGKIVLAVTGGTAALGVISGLAAGAGQLLWPLLAALIGAVISVVIGLITIGLRQALISVLIMISPLAFIAYMLPNTEQYFDKWKKIFTQMLVFYPLFSILFGASQLAGWAIIASASGNAAGFFVIVGLAVQIFPLILSISLLKMSGTVLGAVSSKLSNLGNKANAGVKAWTESHRENAKQNYLANSNRPSAGLRRYLEARSRRRELDTENAKKIHTGRAEYWAQRSILGNQKYDPAYSKDEQKLKTTRYTRNAQLASVVGMDVTNATRDTQHVLGEEFSDRHVKTKDDKRLADHAMKSFLELHRTETAAQNDEYADIDFLMGQYNTFRQGYDKEGRPLSEESDYNYKHYINGAAGALGRKGELTVLGETISKAASAEAKRKAYTNYTMSKYGFNKRAFRNFIVGYYNNDDGLATDEYGREIQIKDPKTGKMRSEKFQGEFLYYHPELLVPYQTKDENGYYFDATDQEGNFVTRIYRSDTPAMKEIFQNWDMPINDPINGLYGMLAGIYPGDYASKGLDAVGLAPLSTTIGGAIRSSNFKEKASFAGPMYAESVSKRLISNPIQQHLAILDNLIKTAKPSGFNTQDYFALNTLANLMDPDNWDEMLFSREALESYRNINSDFLKITRKVTNSLGEEETAVISPKYASDEELKRAVIEKFINKSVPKFINLMSRTTQGIIDNQKPSAQASWHELFHNILNLSENEQVRELLSDNQTSEETRESIQKLRDFRNKYPSFKEPVDTKTGDTIAESNSLKYILQGDSMRKLRKRMRESDERANRGMDGNNIPFSRTAEGRQMDRAYDEDFPPENVNYFVEIDELASSNENPDFFFEAVRNWLDNMIVRDNRFGHVIDGFESHIIMHGQDHSYTVEDHANALKELVEDYCGHDDI